MKVLNGKFLLFQKKMKKLTKKKSASYTFHVWVLPNSIFSKEKVSQSANKINILFRLFGICGGRKVFFYASGLF